jgi:hypothetical protein
MPLELMVAFATVLPLKVSVALKVGLVKPEIARLSVTGVPTETVALGLTDCTVALPAASAVENGTASAPRITAVPTVLYAR